MTPQQFDNTSFKAGMRATVTNKEDTFCFGKTFFVLGIDFTERILVLASDGDIVVFPKRCENIEIVE